LFYVIGIGYITLQVAGFPAGGFNFLHQPQRASCPLKPFQLLFDGNRSDFFTACLHPLLQFNFECLAVGGQLTQILVVFLRQADPTQQIKGTLEGFCQVLDDRGGDSAGATAYYKDTTFFERGYLPIRRFLQDKGIAQFLLTTYFASDSILHGFGD